MSGNYAQGRGRGVSKKRRYYDRSQAQAQECVRAGMRRRAGGDDGRGGVGERGRGVPGQAAFAADSHGYFESRVGLGLFLYPFFMGVGKALKLLGSVPSTKGIFSSVCQVLGGVR